LDRIVKIFAKTFQLFLMLLPLTVIAAPFPAVNSPYREDLTYKVTISNKSSGHDIEMKNLAQKALRREMPQRLEIAIERKKIADKNIIVFTRVEYLQSGNTARWQFVMDTGTHIVMRSMKKKITTQDGSLVREELVNFRARGQGYPDDLLHAHVVELALRGIDFNTSYRNSFPIYLTSINIINMDLKVLGRETVEVPAGKFDCWKVEMKPHLEDWVGKIVANLLRSFTPNYIYWFAVDQNHHLVKYQGILGAIGAPVQVVELVEMRCCDAVD